MEHSKSEVEVLEKIAAKAVEERISELNELQLTLVGGGIGDTYF